MPTPDAWPASAISSASASRPVTAGAWAATGCGVAAPTGYLLVAQGNAMLADQILGELQYFRKLDVDVYVYDYRGYGLSKRAAG